MKDQLAGVSISFLSKQLTLVTFIPEVQRLSYPPPSGGLAPPPPYPQTRAQELDLNQSLDRADRPSRGGLWRQEGARTHEEWRPSVFREENKSN